MRHRRRPIRSIARTLTAAALLMIGACPHALAADVIAAARQKLDAGKVDEAITMLQQAVAAEPANAAALAWLGSAQVRKARTVDPFEAAGWVKKGFDTLDEAVERFPDASVVYAMRGITAAQVPDLFRKAPVAVSDLSTVIAMKERNRASVSDAVMPSVYLYLGLAHKKTGHAADARAAWEKGRALYPSAPEATAIDRELRSL